MKKIISCLAVLAIMTSVTACGSKSENNTTEAETTTAAQTTAAETTISETTSAETTVTTTEATSAETTAEADDKAAVEGSASVSDIAGTWYEQDALDPRTLTINEDGSFILEYKGGGARYGTVKIDYEVFGSGDKRPWYNLYQDEDEEPYFSFAGDMDGEQLTEVWDISAEGDEVHFRRDIAISDESISAADPNEYGYYPVDDSSDTNISIAALEGEWYCSEKDEYLVFSHVHNESTYTRDFVITYSDGTIDEGIVTLEYSLTPDNEKEYWYNLYYYDGKFLIGFGADENTTINDLYAGQSGDPHYVRESNGVFSGWNAEDYLGVWACGRTSITIEENTVGYLVNIHWASSAAEGTVWEYQCSYDKELGVLRCSGSGTCTNYICDEDGNESSTTVYSDGSATVEINDGVLIWNDEKEDFGDGLEFLR